MPTIVSGLLPGPAGDLEYVLTEPGPEDARIATDAAQRVAVVSHPHPLYGGSLNTRIVFHVSRALVQLGIPVLRFNFRGVGKSEGVHDEGCGEQEDLKAAMTFARLRFPRPLVLAGFSFGATVTVHTLAGNGYPEVQRVLIVGLPVGRAMIPTRWNWNGPKLLISGDNDEFASVAALEEYFGSLEEPKMRFWISGADHFLSTRISEFSATIAGHLDFA